jgi:hypothetical protein
MYYYLRTGPGADTPDHRTKYTPKEKDYLVGLTRKELQAYADKHDLSFDALYAVKLRTQQAMMDAPQSKEISHKICTKRCYLNFSSYAELAAYDFPRGVFKSAKEALRKAIKGLTLYPPNIMAHLPTNKYTLLNLDEQRQLLKNPKRFLKEHGTALKNRWMTYNPNRDCYVIFNKDIITHPDSVGAYISAHSTLALVSEELITLMNMPIPINAGFIYEFDRGPQPELQRQKGEPVLRKI